MIKYEEKILTHNDLFTEYESFLFIEGQMGLPDMPQRLHEFLTDKNLTVWSVEEVFEKKDRIKAIPHLNPSVVIFQTTGLHIEQIKSIISYFESINWKPDEIWEFTTGMIPTVDSERYNVFDCLFDYYNKEIILTKL